jgi:predicted nucleic acid-binding protein
MDKIVMDTSAFFKLYQVERGSAWLKNFVVGKEISISRLVLYECGNTLARLSREGVYTKSQGVGTYQQIRQDSLSHIIVPIDAPEVLDKSIDIAFDIPPNLRLRTLDSIHLATALIAQEATKTLNPTPLFTFITADAQLVRTAQHFGLTVENPENHP